jgi:hypothetical protein
MARAIGIRKHWPWWVGVMLVVGATLLILPLRAAAVRPDPSPSPLFQQSLKTSIARFDDPTGGVTSNRTSHERLRLASQNAAAGAGGSVAAPVRPTPLSVEESQRWL